MSSGPTSNRLLPVMVGRIIDLTVQTYGSYPTVVSRTVGTLLGYSEQGDRREIVFVGDIRVVVTDRNHVFKVTEPDGAH